MIVSLRKFTKDDIPKKVEWINNPDNNRFLHYDLPLEEEKTHEVYTNKATTEYRETKLANLRVILRKPYCEIDTKNAETLQFLDLIKEVVDISEVDGEELTKRLLGYMKKKNIGFESMKPFLPYYPDRIYKNMYEVGLLNGVSV